MDEKQRKRLRTVINESIRIQEGIPESVPYIDVGNALSDAASRQNHVIFGRRGCGKSLLLRRSADSVADNVKCIYLNCEDFKRHSFPNVLIVILDALLVELQANLKSWFGLGKKGEARAILEDLRTKLGALKLEDDEMLREIKETENTSSKEGDKLEVSAFFGKLGAKYSDEAEKSRKMEVERRFTSNSKKIVKLDLLLPTLKNEIRRFFKLSTRVTHVFLQLDDFYHLQRPDQTFVIDYVHRLCKDVPLYFKVATLRHSTTLFSDRDKQPIGAQERHDFQPIDVDFRLSDFARIVDQNWKILFGFGNLAGIKSRDIQSLFKGRGFDRLVLAGGGVPRDVLSLFLGILESVQPPAGDGRIGKDDVRISSRTNLERRIEELKKDSDAAEQAALLRGIYVIRKFALSKGSNVLLVRESSLQTNDKLRDLLNRILDYRIIHEAGAAVTHKSEPGSSLHAFAVDIGCYAHMRVLAGRLKEIDLADSGAREQMRSAPILEEGVFADLWKKAPEDAEAALASDEEN